MSKKATIYGVARLTFIDLTPQIRGKTRFRFGFYDTHTDNMLVLNNSTVWGCIQELAYDYKQETEDKPDWSHIEKGIPNEFWEDRESHV